MENKSAISMLDYIKSVKDSAIYEHMSVEIDKAIEFLSSKDLLENFSEFEQMVYGFKNIPKIFFLSILLASTDNQQKYLREILKVALNEKDMPVNTKYFLLYQCANIILDNKTLDKIETKKIMLDLYFHIYGDYKAKFSSYLDFIPKEQRNEKLIFIFTPQILSLDMTHTKAAIESAYYLKKIGYDVVLINTTELLSQGAAIPFYANMLPEINHELKQQKSIKYLDEDIPYFQCSEYMPNVHEIELILNITKEHKPFLALNLGFYSVTADLCSNIVSVASISTIESQLPATFSKFHLSSKTIDENDKNLASLYGFSEENFIPYLFAPMFSKKDKKSDNYKKSIEQLIEKITSSSLFK